MRYRVDGETWCESPMTLLSFCNSQYTGGAMHMAPGAEVDDGQLDVIHADAMGHAALLGAFPGLFRGAHVTRAGVHVLRGTGVEFDAAAVARDVLIDGEIRHLALRRIDVIPGPSR
ncbi:MAG: hypothetical protein R3A78_02460 [Polyangiales bacterium]